MKVADGEPVVALAMDELNNEGLVGTGQGSVYYLNFNEKMMIKIVSKATPNEVSIVRFQQPNA